MYRMSLAMTKGDFSEGSFIYNHKSYDEKKQNKSQESSPMNNFSANLNESKSTNLITPQRRFLQSPNTADQYSGENGFDGS